MLAGLGVWFDVFGRYCLFLFVGCCLRMNVGFGVLVCCWLLFSCLFIAVGCALRFVCWFLFVLLLMSLLGCVSCFLILS